MVSNGVLETLVHLKARALFHDPPHKMWLIPLHQADFGVKHREEAKKLFKECVRGTPLDTALPSEQEAVIELVDRVASSFDRWVLRVYRWPSGSYVFYSRLHNIFDPRIGRDLAITSSNLQGSLHNFASDINELLKEVENLVSTRSEKLSVLSVLYNFLYVVFEGYWYLHRLPVSLADTRTPTHTVFDHLYASATLMNAFMMWAKARKPLGFLAIIDFAGIQKFVNAGRKVGDFWASSWLLSNIMWRTVDSLALDLGFDIVLSPTARLNPYAIRSVLSVIANKNFYEVRCQDSDLPKPIADKICSRYPKLYGIELDEIWLQPIIPAVITLLLPPILPGAGALDEDAIILRIVDLYRKAWNEITDFVFDSLSRQQDSVSRFLYKKLEEIKDILSIPPQGLRITVVRLDDIYSAVTRCIRDKDESACRDLDLALDLDKLHSFLGEFSKRGKIPRDVLVEDLCLILSWHIVTTHGLKLVVEKHRYGKSINYLPRPFWVARGESIEAVSNSVYSNTHRRDWISCYLCNDEPAVLRLTKTSSVWGHTEFSDEAKKLIVKNLGEEAEALQREGSSVFEKLRVIIKPGEALGPYCLFKRALYYVANRRYGNRIASTDFIALSRISEVVEGKILGDMVNLAISRIYEELKKINPNLPAKTVEAVGEVVRNLYSSQPDAIYKDIELSARGMDVSYEGFVSIVSNQLRNACREVLEKSIDRGSIETIEQYLSSIMKALAIDIDKPEVRYLYESILSKWIATKSVSLQKLCSYIGLPTSIAIVRGDADNIGEIKSLKRGLDIDSYLDIVESSLIYKAEFIGCDRDIAIRYLHEGFEYVRELLKILGLSRGLNSPTRVTVLSMALMLSALEDIKTVKELNGLLVYSGGDDVFVLSPAEVGLKLAITLRERFNGDGFRYILLQPVAPSIPTGRSFSVRFANIMDLLNAEALEAYELLESMAKSTRWLSKAVTEGVHESAKDTLVVSDSRVSVNVLLPLSIYKLISQTLEMLLVAMITGVISRGIPEDIERARISVVDSDRAKYAMLAHILSRNIVKPRSDGSLHQLLLATILDSLSKYLYTYAKIDSEERSLIDELFNLIRIVRRYI